MAARAGGNIRRFALDVTDSDQIQRQAETLRDEKIDILLNNAGVSGPQQQDFGPIDSETWLKTFHVNTIAPMQMASAFVEQVARSRRKIIAVALHPGWVRTRMGGADAPTTARESATDLFQVLTTLTLKDTGKPWAHNGQILPW